jgi:hypothetical protein
MGIDAIRSRALHDDAAELLAEWLLCEIEIGCKSGALALLKEFASYEAHCSSLTNSLVVLAEAEMAALGWLDTANVEGGAEAVLEHARAELNRCDLGYYLWRLAWRHGQLHARMGNHDLAARHSGRARSELLLLSDSLDSPRLAEAFLGLPSQSAFIAELEAG